MEELKKPDKDYNQNDFLVKSDRKIQKKSLSKWYIIIISIILGLFLIHLIFKYFDSGESEYKGKRYYIENVACKKDSTVTFNFNQKIMKRTVRFINEDNVRGLIITVDYFPSRRIEVLDFDKAKKKKAMSKRPKYCYGNFKSPREGVGG